VPSPVLSAMISSGLMRVLLLAALTFFAWRPQWTNDNCEDLYSVLGASPHANSSEIKKAWHKNSLLLHPDKRQTLSHWTRLLLNVELSRRGLSTFDELFHLCFRAYSELSSVDQRAIHDERLASCRASQSDAAKLREQRDGPSWTYLGPNRVLSTINASYIFQKLTFLLLFIVLVMPTFSSILRALAQISMNLTGAAARENQRKTEGLWLARNRQAEEFRAKKREKVTASPNIALGSSANSRTHRLPPKSGKAGLGRFSVAGLSIP